jgi:hypothetical protein
MNVQISQSYHEPVRTAAILSFIIMVFCGLLLDGGLIGRPSVVALSVFWALVVVVICRRPRNPTPTDLSLIRWGCLLFVVAFDIAIFSVWHLRGLL